MKLQWIMYSPLLLTTSSHLSTSLLIPFRRKSLGRVLKKLLGRFSWWTWFSKLRPLSSFERQWYRWRGCWRTSQASFWSAILTVLPCVVEYYHGEESPGLIYPVFLLSCLIALMQSGSIEILLYCHVLHKLVPVH